jgi:hypothetical protein
VDGQFQCHHCHRITRVLSIDGSESTELDESDPDHPDNKATDDGDERNAAAFMGGTDEVDAVPQQEDYEPRRFEPSAGGLGRPTATLPIDQLEAIDPIQRRELARDRGQAWPSTEEARERLFRTITQTMRNEDDRVIDAPTSLGKSYAVAATPWGSAQYAGVTGGRPVVHLSKTRDARDEAVATSQAADVDHLVLRARTEACPVCAGEYDPSAVEGTDRPGLTVEGQPASEWLDLMCDERGLSLSVAHHYLAARLDQDVELPCSERTPCPAIQQWTTFREGDHSLVHATHNFAHVPGLRVETNVVLDEQTDFQVDLSTDRVQRAITAYLRAVDAPVTTWEQFLTLARYDADGARTDADREREALADSLDREPDLEWYVDTPGPTRWHRRWPGRCCGARSGPTAAMSVGRGSPRPGSTNTLVATTTGMRRI